MKPGFSTIKNMLLHGLEKAGYTLVPIDKCRPVDLRHASDSLLDLSYRFPSRQLLINAPLNAGVSYLDYPLGIVESLSPTIRKAYDTPGQEKALLREGLRQFYAAWQPANAAEFFKLDPDQAQALGELPAWLSCWPWDHRDPERLRIARERRKPQARGDATSWGPKATIDFKWKFCGPITEERLDAEVQRMARLVCSIRRQGYCRHDNGDGDIRAAVLICSDGSWRWFAYSGQHRQAIARVLMGDRVPIRVISFVRRNEVAHWPGVTSGLFDEPAALHVFDDFFRCSSRRSADRCQMMARWPEGRRRQRP